MGKKAFDMGMISWCSSVSSWSGDRLINWLCLPLETLAVLSLMGDFNSPGPPGPEPPRGQPHPRLATPRPKNLSKLKF